MFKNKKIIYLVGSLVLYLASAGISFASFRYFNGTGNALVSPLQNQGSGFNLDLNAPKTEVCPINGGMFTKGEKQLWEKRRPLTVMIENHADSRPQSGLGGADVVYEAVAEGGITRFLAVFYCGAVAEEVTIGPIRSARTYFMDFASEYGDYPLYAHVGGANKPGKTNALGQIGDYGWLSKGNDMNQFSLGFPVFWRDYERIGHPVATEHTMYSTTEKLWEVADKRGLNAKDEEGNAWNEDFVSWKFKDDAKVDDRGDADLISFEFWSSSPDYAVKWQYDKENNYYSRQNDGQAFIDNNDDQQVKAKTIIVQFMKETGPINELKHMLYGTIGTGKALIFQDGEATTGTWEKEDRQSRTIFEDNQGKEISLVRGPVWVEILPIGNEVNY